jgi:diguanylate cyclase (GGDEF)-like protein
VREFGAFVRDITARKRTEEQLRTMALLDSLTGLNNRRAFFATAEQQLSLASRTGQSVTVLFVDVDDMKTINDTYGHGAGDAALAATAVILTSTFRSSDLLARIGGDEFCVVQIGAVEGDPARRRLEAAVREYNATSGWSHPLSLAVGEAHVDDARDVSIETLVSLADKDMYAHKRERP